MTHKITDDHITVNPKKDCRSLADLRSGRYHRGQMQNLKKLRKSRNLSQEELGAMIDRDQSYISQMERGVAEGVSLRVIKDLAAALGVEDADLFAHERATEEQIILQYFRRLDPKEQVFWLKQAEASLETQSEVSGET